MNPNEIRWKILTGFLGWWCLIEWFDWHGKFIKKTNSALTHTHIDTTTISFPFVNISIFSSSVFPPLIDIYFCFVFFACTFLWASHCSAEEFEDSNGHVKNGERSKSIGYTFTRTSLLLVFHVWTEVNFGKSLFSVNIFGFTKKFKSIKLEWNKLLVIFCVEKKLIPVAFGSSDNPISLSIYIFISFSMKKQNLLFIHSPTYTYPFLRFSFAFYWSIFEIMSRYRRGMIKN